MILLYGQLDDPPLVQTLEALQALGSPYLLLAQSALTSDALRVDIGPEGVSGELLVAGQRVALEHIDAVYARPLDIARYRFGADLRARAEVFHEQLCQWFDVAEALVVNRPRAMQANASKPFQAQWIGQAGFEVPETLVTSDPDEARAFWRVHERIIFKSISGVRSIVREFGTAEIARLGLLARLPVQFQALVEGVDVRVHVVGEETFSAEIRSSAVDYRYAGQQGADAVLTPTELPRDVASRCVALARDMGLPLAGIDLRRRQSGSYVCFEVNPMPAYTYFQSHTGLRISDAIARLLVDAHGTPEYKEAAWFRASTT